MSALQQALVDAGVTKPRTGPTTPQNPSRSATARVTNPLPVPTVCPYCDGAVELVNNSEIYGRSYGEWPWAYRCADDDCDAYVGLHPQTAIPLGTLANAQLRQGRKDAKAAFNPIWKQGEMTRSEAYRWLAGALNIADVGQCHIGWFDLAMCRQVTRQCYRRRVAMQATK